MLWSQTSSVADIALAGLIVGIVGMLVLPLPTFILDPAHVEHHHGADHVVGGGVHPNALKLSSFPFCWSTSFAWRSMSAQRLILLDADAGDVIAAPNLILWWQGTLSSAQ